ncbi:MAG: alpha-1,2-mannosyltransferase [Chlamydiales bacterium]|jgi:alpha-1,2-mannosyltransferase
MSTSRRERWVAWLRSHGPLVLGVLLSIMALVQANHRALQGRSALLRWEDDFQALWAGEDLYAGVVDEGYPTLPVTLIVMQPFRALGEHLGAVVWAAFKIGLAWWLVTRALALAAGRARDFPVWGQYVVLLLSFRVLSSDVQHGNINLLVGAAVASAAWSWQRGRSLTAGLWIGIGAAMKVTPALGLVLLLWHRSVRGLAGFSLGLLLGALLPAPFVGLERTLELDLAWWHQMVAPYLGGRVLTLMQSAHINQSLFGVLARYLTDAVAIEADPPKFPQDVRIGLLALQGAAFRAVHLCTCLAVLAGMLLSLRPRVAERNGLAVLGEFSMLALAMVMLSERSWKHHYVLLAFPLAFLVAQCVPALSGPRDRTRVRLAVAGVVSSALLHGATGSAFLGGRGSDFAEAYGVYLAGAVVLFVSVGLCSRRIDP